MHIRTKYVIVDGKVNALLHLTFSLDKGQAIPEHYIRALKLVPVRQLQQGKPTQSLRL